MPIPKREDDAIVEMRSTLADIGVDPAILGYLSDEQAKAVMKALLHLFDKYCDKI
jgi:hypothetical protein